MLTKLIGKLLLRATIPLVAMVGIASFGLHSVGGDPLAILKSVTGGFGQQVASLLGNARDSADVTFSAAKSGLGSDKKRSSSQQLYRWTDSAGVTHFSNEPPADVKNVTTLTVNPNRNVMDASKPPKPEKAAFSTAAGHDPVKDVMQQPMPGMSGMALQGMNPNEIIQQFQQVQQSRLPE